MKIRCMDRRTAQGRTSAMNIRWASRWPIATCDNTCPSNARLRALFRFSPSDSSEWLCMNLFTRAGLVPAILLALVACSESPKESAKKEPEKPAEPVTGRQAFQQMYPMARAWARDAQPLQLQSYNLQQVKSEKG